MQSLNITREQFSRLLRDHNLTREQFIARYGLRPLVYTPELPGRAKLALVLTGVLIFALALFGNSLVVYVVTRSKAMRTVTNIFICSLALSDLLIAFFCIPVTMVQNISDTWRGGESTSAPSSLIPQPSTGLSPPLCSLHFSLYQKNPELFLRTSSPALTWRVFWYLISVQRFSLSFNDTGFLALPGGPRGKGREN